MNQKIVATGILTGIGMGGFIDGIVFHQILQTHSMLSGKLELSVLANLKASMFWDGMFHSFTWLATLIAIVMLLKLQSGLRGQGRSFIWAAVAGWGIFNLLEGLTDHHLLSIHHVVEKGEATLYDYLYLLSGVIFIVIGYIMAHRTGNKGMIDANNISNVKVTSAKDLIIAGVLLGMGLGGILEGIMFFQVFQLHSMISAILPPDSVENVRGSMFWDGIYHVFTWTLTATAIYKSYHLRASLTDFPHTTYWGAALVGLGSLNIIEAIIDHHLFSIHHVVERLGLSVYDYIFIAASAALVIIGSVLIRRKVVVLSV